MSVQYARVRVDSLVENPSNLRRHPRRSVDAIRQSHEAFGVVWPLVVQKGTMIVIAGNGNLRAARERGEEWIDVGIVDVAGAEMEALGIALNRCGDLSGWDEDLLEKRVADVVGRPLSPEAQQLEIPNITLGDLGFTEDELARTLAESSTAGLSDSRDVQARGAQPTLKLGDIGTVKARRDEFYAWLERFKLKHGHAEKDVAAALLRKMGIEA